MRVTNPDATDGTEGLDNANLNGTVVSEMVALGIQRLTEQTSIEDAWAQIIPDPTATVAIKVNCQIEAIYTKAKIVNAVVYGLTRIGVAPGNILIYDLGDTAFKFAGFEKNLGPGVKIGTNDDFGGYSRLSKFHPPGPGGSIKFCTVVAGRGKYSCDYIINVPVLKALDGYCGVTMAMKNHFGSIANPWELHANIHRSVAALNAHRFIRGKTRLILVDGVFAQYKWTNGRDQANVTATNQIMLGKDSVAIDSVGWWTIEQLREKNGLDPISPPPEYLTIAAEEFGLGNTDINKMDILDL